jgi:hypothetical protein
METTERRKNLANQILHNELLSEIFDELEQEIITDWKGADTTEAREKLHHRIEGLQITRDIVYETARDIAEPKYAAKPAAESATAADSESTTE